MAGLRRTSSRCGGFYKKFIMVDVTYCSGSSYCSLPPLRRADTPSPAGSTAPHEGVRLRHRAPSFPFPR